MINILCVVLAGVLYYFAPEGYDYTFCASVAGLYIAQNAAWMCLRKDKNWMRFELLFMLSFFFVNFAYPLFYADTCANWSFFEHLFNRQVINQATALGYLGYTWYMLGIVGIGERLEVKGERLEVKGERLVWMMRILGVMAVVSFGMFVATGGYTALSEVYSDGKNLRDVGIYSYFNNLFSISALLMAAFVFQLERQRRWVYLGLLVAFILCLLSTGSRQFSISLVVILLVSYNWHIYHLKGWQVAIVVFLGAVVLFGIMLMRTGGKEQQYVSMWDMFEDLTINALNLYVLTDWGNSHDCTWLHGMLLDLCSPIPKLGSWLVDYTGEAPELLHGGDLPSYLLLGREAGWGTGTNMVGEAFRSFGLAGMCIVMWGIGAVIRWAYNHAGENIYWCVFYLLMVGHAVIYPRAPILYDPRTIIWSLVLLWGVKWISGKLVVIGSKE